MKYIVTIEETNVKDFVVEAQNPSDAQSVAEGKYRNGEFVLDPGECQFKQIAIMKTCDKDMKWRVF